jgi:hypothetical protein
MRQRSPSPLEEDPVDQEVEVLHINKVLQALDNDEDSEVEFLCIGKALHTPDNDEDSEVEFLYVGKSPHALDNNKDSEQAWTDGTIPRPGDAHTRSVEDLAGSVVDVIPPHVPDDAIDQLTADLAVFCFN